MRRPDNVEFDDLEIRAQVKISGGYLCVVTHDQATAIGVFIAKGVFGRLRCDGRYDRIPNALECLGNHARADNLVFITVAQAGVDGALFFESENRIKGHQGDVANILIIVAHA